MTDDPLEVTVTDVPAATYAVVRETVSPPAGATIVRLIDEVRAAVEPTGPPLCMSSMTPEGLAIAVGWTVADDAAEPPAPVELVRCPAGRAAVHVHVGPYDELPPKYGRLWEQLRADGLEPAGEPREIYEGQDERAPVTRIVWPLAD